MLKNYWPFVVLVLVTAIAGCGQQNISGPQVVEVFPAQGYHGFKKSDVITIKFDRPININSFLEAYDSTSDGLMPDQVSYAFLDEGKTVVIKPGKPLAYSPDDSYANFGFEVGTELIDLDGHHMKEPLRVTFTTMRTLTANIYCAEDLDGTVSGQQAVNDQSAIYVGDNASNAGMVGFLAYPWPADSDGVIAATLHLYVAGINNTPFTDLGSLTIEPVDIGDGLDPTDVTSTPILAPTVTDDGSGWDTGSTPSYDVGEYAKAAWDLGLTRLDLRLRFDKTTDNDGKSDSVVLLSREAEDAVDNEMLQILELTYYGP